MDTDAHFCWTELATTDPEKAGKFFERLFGWQRSKRPFRTPSGRSIDYTLLTLGGLNVGGMYAMSRGQLQQGFHSSWLPYLFVADARQTGRRAEELGGKILAPPVEVGDLGHLSILRDPQGAVFGTWQAIRLGSGFQTRGQPGFSCWFEHVSEDASRAARFYGSLLGGSQARPDRGGAARVLLEQGGAPVAGFTSGVQPPGSRLPQWLTFFQVTDCEASCEKVAALYGTVLAPPVGAPGSGRHAVVSDPLGAVFGLLQTVDRA